MEFRNDKLRIDEVAAGQGYIGMTLCPGKKQTGAASGNWNRELKEDLDEILSWGAASVVSVIEQSELAELRVSDLGEKVEASGLDWFHLPVRDAGSPGPDFEALWVYTGHQLHRSLSRGERVLIHCKGGLGRTGTIAARLLVELGDSATEAIRKVRAARAHAIETDEQEQYVQKCRAVAGDHAYADRVLGCLLGGAVGDAFGYAIEFKSWETIRDQYGPQGLQQPELRKGQAVVSDDTQMTMFTVEGLLRALRGPGCRIIDEIRVSYGDWLLTQGNSSDHRRGTGELHKDPLLCHRRAPGNTCLQALHNGRAVEQSKGCGGVMRVAPLGLVRQWTLEQSFDYAAEAAALTHGHPSGYLSAGACAAILRLLLDGRDLREAIEKTMALLGSKPTHAEVMTAIDRAIRKKRSNKLPAVSDLGEGWIAEEALSIAVYSALKGDSFVETLVTAANHSGDSDSTASIAGQLHGARKGLSDLPNSWIRRIDVLIPLLRLTGELIASQRSYQ